MPLDLIEPLPFKPDPKKMLRTESAAYALLDYNNGDLGLVCCPLWAATEQPDMNPDAWYEPESCDEHDEAFYNAIFEALKALRQLP